MPIYEYYCSKCNMIYQFLVRRMDEEPSPECPKCGSEELERVMSTFSTTRKSTGDISDMVDDPELAGIDEDDPRSMARAIRHMADEMGEDLGPELEEAISRLEAGEDPEKIERELEEAGFGEEMGAPGRDPGLYEA
ncbi:zinc ribbon domain-containing protein [Candidatus Fermentibacteria bacterium]|nr:zinc ribbon domain-containing protein [Candidatus Fermentibacteria bacterium]